MAGCGKPLSSARLAFAIVSAQWALEAIGGATDEVLSRIYDIVEPRAISGSPSDDTTRRRWWAEVASGSCENAVQWRVVGVLPTPYRRAIRAWRRRSDCARRPQQSSVPIGGSSPERFSFCSSCSSWVRALVFQLAALDAIRRRKLPIAATLSRFSRFEFFIKMGPL